MWVTREDFTGTIGGGELEHRILKYARELLDLNEALPHLKEYTLCKDMNQCCGGRVEMFFEIVPRQKTVHLFGGGHVGRATAETLSQMPFEVVLIDSRPEWSTSNGLPKDIRALQADPLDYVQKQAWSAQDAVCIFTHSHDLDFALAKFFLSQPVGYLGLIGSDHKARVFQARLAQEGRLQELWEEKMRCPIGIPLDSKVPKVIGVSIAAELLKEWALVLKKPELVS